MKMMFGTLKKLVVLLMFFLCLISAINAQAPQPPIPAELLVGNKGIYSQLAFKRGFSPESRFNFFTLATYSTNYEDLNGDLSMLVLSQVSYELGKGFGVMAGADVQSRAGFSPVIGPQHTFASRQFLAVTIMSYFLNESNDLKLFGMYEYKPPLNRDWSLYTRLQFIYKVSLAESSHERSYLYLRAGVKHNRLVFGLGVQLDQIGPNKIFIENYGIFVRWEFQ